MECFISTCLKINTDLSVNAVDNSKHQTTEKRGKLPKRLIRTMHRYEQGSCILVCMYRKKKVGAQRNCVGRLYKILDRGLSWKYKCVSKAGSDYQVSRVHKTPVSKDREDLERSPGSLPSFQVGSYQNHPGKMKKCSIFKAVCRDLLWPKLIFSRW